MSDTNTCCACRKPLPRPTKREQACSSDAGRDRHFLRDVRRREPGYPQSLTTDGTVNRSVVGGVFSLAAALIMASPVGSAIWWWGGRG